MMMKMLQSGGIRIVTDEQRKSDYDNPGGYFEYEKIKELNENSAWLREMNGRAVKVVSMMLYHLPRDLNYKVLFIKRDIREILKSQKKMLGRLNQKLNGPSDSIMTRKFQTHLDKVDQWIRRNRKMECHYVNFNGVLKDSLPHCRQIRDFINRELDVDAMAQVVDPTLYRNRIIC